MTWHVMVDDDADALAGSGKKLRRNDLDTLCNPQGWMSDALLDYGVTVCPSGEVHRPLGHLYQGVFWIEPTVVTSGKDGDAGAFGNTLGGPQALGRRPLQMDKERFLPKAASVLLFPVNRDNRHWSLLAFYAADRKFVHFDSLQESNAAEAKKLIKKLFEMKYLSAELPMETSAQVKTQEDGYNCGIFTILLARLHMEAGARPGNDAVAAVDSAVCDTFREVMLQSLGPLVADLNPQSMIEPGGVPAKPEAVRAEERQQLEKAIEKVERQLEAEEDVPIKVSGMEPCPEAAPATFDITLRSSDPRPHDFASAKVTFVVGGGRVSRKATERGQEWVVEGQRLTAGATFDLEIKGAVEPAAAFENPEQTLSQKAVKAGDKKKLSFTFKRKPDRTLYARFLVEEEKGVRPFPPGLRVEFVLDHGAERVSATTDAKGACSALIPWSCTHVGIAFPASGSWRQVTWQTGSDLESQTSFKTLAEQPLEGQPYLLPPRDWELQRDEWHVPEQHFVGKEFRRQIDLSQEDALGSKEEPLQYILNANANPSQGYRMNGKLIEHVVVLMLENRGFDHFMGWLYEGEKPANSYPKKPVGQHAKLRPFEGLEGIDLSCPYDFNYVRKSFKVRRDWNARRGEGVVPLKKGARAANTPKINPHEDFINVFQDMYGKDVVPDPKAMEDAAKRKAAVQNEDGSYKKPAMNGWAHNYCDGILHHAGHGTVLTHEKISEIMDMFLPDQLPVLSGLARSYGVSDLWFCSVPSQTNTNRSFWLTGSAAGLVKNDFYPAPHVAGKFKDLACDRLPKGGQDGMLHRRSLFDVLEENGVTWRYYWTLMWPPKIGGVWPKDLLPQFEAKRFKSNIPLIAQFYKDAESGHLPAVTYLEPLWGGGEKWDTSSPLSRYVGNEFHPVQDVTYGEFFVKQVYDTLFGDKVDDKGQVVPRNPKRDTTVLLITFDENGGTFDHLPPWKAAPTGREPEKTQFGFKFDCYGIRVPTLLISKYVPEGTVFRSPTEVPFDHASVLSTILKWRGIPASKWKLGERVANAPTFDGVLEGDGKGEDVRRKNATGMKQFDKQRAKIATGEPIKYGQIFSLKYAGDRWPFDNAAAEPKPKAAAGERPERKLHRQHRLELPAPDYLGGPHTWGNYYYPVGTRDAGKALKLKFSGGRDGEPVKSGAQVVIEVVDGPAKGYTLAVPAVMGASSVYLYKGDNPSKWLPWIWNDRTENEPLYYGEEIFLFSERYEPDRLTLYYDPYQKLAIDKFKPAEPALQRYARFRAGEWDIWKVEKIVEVSQEVRPVLQSDRTRAVLEGAAKKAVPVKLTLKLEYGNPAGPKDFQYALARSSAQVEVFLDEQGKKALSFDGDQIAKLDAIAADLRAGKTVAAWARPKDDQAFRLVFSAYREKGKAEAPGAPFAGAPAVLEFERAFSFLDGPSRWLQLVDSFETVDEIKSSIDRIRSLSALADMSADELANFAIKRLFIRKGVLEQQVVIRIDGKPTGLSHPLTEGKLPLRYSDFIVDRSGPKFLGALDAEVAVEALMYKDCCISTKLDELKKKGKAQSFDPDLIQSVRDLAERRLDELQEALPTQYPEVSDAELEAATSVFELKHMAQRKLSDFDLTARETGTLSQAIAAELRACGKLPDELIAEIGRTAWSMGGSVQTEKVKEALKQGGAAGAKAAAAYRGLCNGAEYTAKKEHKHFKYAGTGYYHILIHEVGAIACNLLADSMPDVDKGYGLAIPYMGPQVIEKDDKFEREPNPKEQDRFEIGDIIVDETSHYGTVFSHDFNIKGALEKLKAAGVNWSYEGFDKTKNLRDNCRALLKSSNKPDIAKAYFEREGFIDAVLMFEQVAKKEAQAQFFKVTKNASKLIGNVSDVSQFLIGVDIAAMVARNDGDQARVQRMEALKEVVQLSCLIAFPRWSVFARNLAQAGETAAEIDPKEFASSINERSYAHKKVPLDQVDVGAPRVHVEWAGIDEKIARQRLDDFAEGMGPIWSFVRQQKKHFENMDALIRAIQGNAVRADARKAVREELAKILPKLANLSAQIKGQEAALVDALAGQAEESAQFQVTRAPEEKP